MKPMPGYMDALWRRANQPDPWPAWRRRRALCVNTRTTAGKGEGWGRQWPDVHVLDGSSCEWRLNVERAS